MNSWIWETPFPPFLFPGIMLVFVQQITFILIGKSTKTVATRAALFGSNMHQIVCRLASPQTHWGELTALPQTL